MDFWSFRWHQSFRYVFVELGSRPGGAKLGRLGALLGAFALSGLLHDFGMWGLGKEMEPRSVTGFFLLMSVGTALEYGFKASSRRPVVVSVGFVVGCGVWCGRLAGAL
jgi:Membrane bound O-acyl transferase family